VNKQQENDLLKDVQEHDRLLRGNGNTEGLLHSVRDLLEEAKSRKRLQQTILIGVISLLVERVLTLLSKLT
jgi:hypothetical protein